LRTHLVAATALRKVRVYHRTTPTPRLAADSGAHACRFAPAAADAERGAAFSQRQAVVVPNIQAAVVGARHDAVAIERERAHPLLRHAAQ